MRMDSLRSIFRSISAAMTAHRDELIALDQQFGDGDLGISMDDGFRAVSSWMDGTEEDDLGRALMQCSTVLNGSAPSSLGTILSFGLMGMAKELKGKPDASLSDCARAMRRGLELIMAKAGSRPGEKTILDALAPAIEALEQNATGERLEALSRAAGAAAAGAEATREMRAVHGRAAYNADRTVGQVDAGAVVGRYLFEAIRDSLTSF